MSCVCHLNLAWRIACAGGRHRAVGRPAWWTRRWPSHTFTARAMLAKHQKACFVSVPMLLPSNDMCSFLGSRSGERAAKEGFLPVAVSDRNVGLLR